VRRLVVGVLSTLAVALGAASAAAPAAAEDAAAASHRPGWTPGPDGVDPQHNETLLRDAG
jgi:hypothetical protein